MSSRRFGIEIECFNIETDVLCRELAGVGVVAVEEDYNHTTRPHWKIVIDESVTTPDGECGDEVVSPPLQGEEGLLEMRKVTRVLHNLGARVNRSCGFHVHVDASDLTAKDIEEIVQRYRRFEATIDQMMPPSRRGDNNGYCKSLRGLNVEGTFENFPSQVNEWIRGFNINLHAVVRHGTLEFRQHSGTLNPTKMSHWIRFCLAFVEASKTPVAPQEDTWDRGIPEDVRDFLLSRKAALT